MSFGNYVNLEEVEVQEYSNLGAGNFPMVITADEEKKDDDGSRVYFMVSMQVIEGDHKDAKHNEFFDVVNTKKEIAAKIGKENIKKLATACGKPNATSFAELHNIPFIAIRKTKGEYTNTVAYEGYTVGAAKSAAPAASEKPSWA